MCWAGHPGTTEQPTCCIRCSPINEVSLAGLLWPRRFQKAAMLEGESFDFYRGSMDCYGLVVSHKEIWSFWKNKIGFLPSCDDVSTTVNMHYLYANEMLGEKAK